MRCAIALTLVALSGASSAGPSDDGLWAWSVEAEAPRAARITARGGVIDIDSGAGVTLWYRQRLSAPVSISWEVLPIAAGGPNDAVSDVNAFWMATDPRAPGGSPIARPRDGAFAHYDDLLTYYVGIGGNRNTTTRFRRYVGRAGDRPLRPEHDRADRASLLIPNAWTRIRLTVDARGRVRVAKDGRVILALDDPAPYRSGWFALRTTKSHLRVRHFFVTSAPLKKWPVARATGPGGEGDAEVRRRD